MTAIRVMMRPMNDAPFGVPFIYPIECHDISFLKVGKSWGKINVVGYKQGLAGFELQNKALMTASLVVIRQYSDDYSIPFRLKAALAFIERSGQRRIILIYKSGEMILEMKVIPSDNEGYEKENYRD